MAALGAGTAIYRVRKQVSSDQRNAPNSGSSKRTQTDHARPNEQAVPEKEFAWGRAGSTVGTVAGIKSKITDTTGQLREQVKDLPVNAKYALYHGKKQASEGVRDFTPSVTQTRTARVKQRNAQAGSRRQTITEHRVELEQAEQTQETASEAPKGVAPVHERPATARTKRPAFPAIRERGQVSYGETVTGRTSVPVVKVVSIHHEQISPVRTERQIVPLVSLGEPDERQKIAPAIISTAPRPVRPVQNDMAPVTPERKRAAPMVKESNFTIRHITARKEWTEAGKATAKQKKEEKT